MIEIHIKGWDKSRAWTSWSGHERKQLTGRLADACPSLRLTARKRMTKAIIEGECDAIVVENEKYAESLCHILESTGAVFSTKKKP